MTAPNRSSIPLFNAVVAPGTTTKATAIAASTPEAGNGGWKDVRGFNGGRVGVIVTNGQSAPSPALSYTVQASDSNDGTNVVDIWTGAGDTGASNAPVSASIPLANEFSYVRVLAYGAGTNGVNLKASLFAKG